MIMMMLMMMIGHSFSQSYGHLDCHLNDLFDEGRVRYGFVLGSYPETQCLRRPYLDKLLINQ